MANVITGRQWVLDTAGVVWTDEAKILHFEFVDYLVATDTAILKDRAGRVVWSATGAADLSPIISQDIGWVSGLTVDTLGSGKVIAYIK